MYHYEILNIKVIDGDTVECDVDLGFSVSIRKQRYRLFGINAPEITGATKIAGLRAKSFLENLLRGEGLKAHTVKDKRDKYGRVLLIIERERYNPAERRNVIENVNGKMVEAGHAVEATY